MYYDFNEIYFSPWDDNEPSKNEEGYCGAMNMDGKLRDKACGKSDQSARFICERPLGKPPLCGDEWEHYGKSCYKVRRKSIYRIIKVNEYFSEISL